MAIDLSALNKFTRDGKQKDTPKAPPQKPKKSKPFQFNFDNDNSKDKNGKDGFGKGGVHIGGAPKAPTGTATAPYNFVSLPAQALPSPILSMEGETTQEKYKNYIAQEGKLNGYIDLTITTKTPCFIRLAEKNPVFVSPQGPGKEILPGSSIRGMIKNIFKIVTAGAMRPSKTDGDINDSHLYFRTMASTVPSVQQMYKNELVDHVEKVGGKHYSITKAKAGFLIHCKTGKDENGGYYICTCSNAAGKSFQRVKNHKKISTFSPENAPKIGPNGNGGRCIIWDNPDAVECFSGTMHNKEHYTIHGKPNWGKRIPVPPEVIDAYQNDVSRGGVDLFNEKVCKKDKDAEKFTHDSNIDMVVPCFYRTNKNNTIRHFGFSQFYRVPYDHSVGEFIPEAVRNADIDFSDALFGCKELWGSRLMFEDAGKKKESKTLKEDYSHPLTSPKPTSFQLYLTQSGGSMNTWGDNPLANSLRGYKLYWHNNISETAWQKSADENLEGQEKIRPISAGWQFNGKIRFTNLSQVELGALLKVFKLATDDKSCCFKLGQGKALGMGSVRIEPKLYLETEEYYSKLFTDGKLQSTATETSFNDYCAAFEAYLYEAFTQNERARYDISQKELAALLSWDNIQKDKIATMKIDDNRKPFQNRWILPTALEVK